MSFGRAIVDSLPLIPAYFLWAAIFGAAATSTGFSALQASLMSAIVFSGAAQLPVLKIAHLPLAAIFLTCLLVSLRFVPMTLAISQRLRARPRWLRVALAWTLVDATFALTTRRTASNRGLSAYLLGAFAAAYITWIIGTIAGALSGPLVPRAWATATDALVVVIFVVLTAELCISMPLAAAAVGGGVAALLLAHVMPAGPAMLVAALFVSALLAAARRQTR